MRISITVKHSLLILFAVLATTAILSITMFELLSERLREEVTKRGAGTARHLAYISAPLVLGNDAAKIGVAVQNVLEEPDVVNLTVFNHEGEALVSGGKAVSAPRLPLPDRPLQESDSEAAREIFWEPIEFGGVQLGAVRVTVSREPLKAALESLTWRVALIGFLVAASVVGISFFVLRRTIRPLSQVLAGTRRIAEGDFSARIDSRSRDEVGELAASFNQMAARTELFFRYVDKSVAERLARDETLARPGGRMKPVSVLFGDMRGFTELANRRDPSDVVWILNVYFDLFFQTVHRFGGVVDKTIGDAVLSFFEPTGAEVSTSLRAALAATGMRAATWLLGELAAHGRAQGWEMVFEPRNFGFSVATGRLIVGNVGSNRKMDYTVCGPAVNLAARLLEDTHGGELLLDRFTAMDVEEALQMREMSQIQPKGFAPHQKVTPFQAVQVKGTHRETIRSLLRSSFSEGALARIFAPWPGRSLEGEPLRQLQADCANLIDLDPPRFLVD